MWTFAYSHGMAHHFFIQPLTYPTIECLPFMMRSDHAGDMDQEALSGYEHVHAHGAEIIYLSMPMVLKSIIFMVHSISVDP